MILTQSMHDLGHPAWKVVGLWVGEAECDIGHGGHAVADRYNSAVANVVKALHEQHSRHAVLVNAKIEIRQGSAHPDYGRVKIRISGDLYLRQFD